jgi:Skp family chaperone for outer membrane proteins
MKVKAVIALSCLVGVVVLSTGYELSLAQTKPDQPSFRIAVVNVRDVFRTCQRNATYRQQAMAEYNRTMTELERLSREIEADEAGLKTLKPGSADHLKQYEQTLRKKADLDARQQFLKQQRALKDRQWTEQLYQEVLQITKELAEQKGFDMVFDKQEPEFPASSGDELMLTLSTHKLLYSGGCADITDEVTARLDEKDNADQ